MQAKASPGSSPAGVCDKDCVCRWTLCHEMQWQAGCRIARGHSVIRFQWSNVLHSRSCSAVHDMKNLGWAQCMSRNINPCSEVKIPELKHFCLEMRRECPTPLRPSSSALRHLAEKAKMAAGGSERTEGENGEKVGHWHRKTPRRHTLHAGSTQRLAAVAKLDQVHGDQQLMCTDSDLSCGLRCPCDAFVASTFCSPSPLEALTGVSQAGGASSASPRPSGAGAA